MLCLAHIIDEVSYHPCCLDKQETKYDVHRNIGTNSAMEGSFIAILGHVQKKDLEPDQQLRRDGFLIRGCNNAREDDRCIVIREIK